MTDAPHRTGRRWLALLAGILALACLIFLLRNQILVQIGEFLEVGEEPVPSDIIYLLGGELDTRPDAAVALWKEGFAPKIVLARVPDGVVNDRGILPNLSDATRQLLLQAGVPDSAIVMIQSEHGAASTNDEAALLNDYLHSHPVDRAILLTNNYHTRRVRWIADRTIDADVEITVVGIPSNLFDAQNWWIYESGVLAYVEEYMKFIHNWVYR